MSLRNGNRCSLFRVKYHTENAVKIRLGRLEFARQYGYAGEQLTTRDEITLEKLDALECQMDELAGRMDEAMSRSHTQKVMRDACSWDNLALVEDTLVPILTLCERVVLKARGAKVQVRQFKGRELLVVHNWAAAIEEKCDKYIAKYSVVKDQVAACLQEKQDEVVLLQNEFICGKE